MKKIIFIRHGKAKSESKTDKDFDRKLATKGIIQSNIIGHLLKEKNTKIDCIYSSDSHRTKETIQTISLINQFPLDQISWKPELYLANLNSLIKHCFQLDNKFDNVIICGHNIGLTECLNYFLDGDYELTTCGTAMVSFNTSKWEEISFGTGNLDWLKLPKEIVE